MSNDTKFIDGLIVKEPHQNAPEYVKAKLSIKREELIKFLQGQSGDWINADIKVSQNGKWYAAIDDWKPDANRSSGRGNSRSAEPQRQAPQQAPMDDFSDETIPF